MLTWKDSCWLKLFDKSKRGFFHFWVEGIFVAYCKKREKRQLNLIEKMFRLISDNVQMAYETRYRPCICAQIVPGVTRCIVSLIGFPCILILIGFPCNRIRVRVIQFKVRKCGLCVFLLWSTGSYAISKRMATEIPWMNELNKK